MKKRFLWRNVLIISFLLGFPAIALSASTQTIHVFVTVDSTAPTVISTTPNTGAIGVSLTQDIIVTFSEPMDTPSLSISSTPDPTGWTTSWNAQDTQVTCSHNPFNESTTYTFQITAAKDKAGNNLSSLPYLLTFTTTGALADIMINEVAFKEDSPDTDWIEFIVVDAQTGIVAAGESTPMKEMEKNAESLAKEKAL
ncbi:MAG: Ig-like domain-containing protein [bacterium]|nr:Ig-like domain-containing protein [bacterium]